ncbi:iron complex outermembrane receptor protein [Novosphingobium chloroacetimidivorans]|uniref:Iron complex outermembrane receptor protein n=1 Tax=Novosphingobium chloroacetimidivorans TaxID=1428314 RepID=A0A7W7KCR1_9SPHN|nr:TonB-dependent receptor [Novosphingobium chloroacetimidivorans]MBB4860130.1 iron complex outermembrane receptor protein [Novosphingobium chloroacetimidivorans]
MLKKQLRASTAFGAILASTVFVAVPALAQAQAQAQETATSDDDVIIVTAQRRAEAQVDVPISITTLSSEALDTANVQQLSDIGKVTPALRFDFAGGFFQPTIRGIGTAVTTSGGGGNVGIYIDGFYSPNPLAADFDLISVSSIQVLKGPQGTLFGRNTTGGAILVSTREPNTTANSFEGRASYGRYNEARVEGIGNFVISDRVALSVEGQYRRGDGWQRDISTGDRVGEYENWSARVSLKADLTDDVSLLLRYKHGEVDDPSPLLASSYVGNDVGLGAPFGGIPGTFTTRKNEIASGNVPEFFRSNSDSLQATLTVDLGFANLTSYTQYRNERVSASQDLDYSGVELATAAQRAARGIPPTASVGFQLGLPNRNQTWSQELLLTSKTGTRLQWTAGLFYFENTDRYITGIDNFGTANRIRLGGSSTTVRSYAAFADATYEITPKLFLTGGVRYAYDKVDDAYYNTRFLNPAPVALPNGTFCSADGGRVYLKECDPGAIDFANSGRLTPRAVIRYKPDERSSIYASFTRGYKAAVVDVGGSCQNPPFVCSRVSPESVNAYEIGAKYEKPGFSLEAAGFYYDYKDLQISIFEAGTARIVNAAQSEIYGLEGAAHVRPVQGLQLSAGASWVHARYKDFNNAPIYTPCSALGAATVATCNANGISFLVLGQNLDNVTMQRTPEFTGYIGARYATEVASGELALSGNLSYSSSFFFGPSGTQFRQGGYETLSLRAQWTAPDDRWYLAAYGDNVTNSRYLTQVQYSNFGIGSNWSKPTTFGGEVGFKF